VGELHHRKEEVGEQAKRLVDPVHEQDFLLGVIPEVPDCPADDAPVLLLHWSVVVLPVWTGPCLGDVLLMTVTDQMVVHELAPVIRMDAQEKEREAAANTSQGSEDLFLTLVPHCPGLGPPCCHVGDVQGAGILPSGNTAFMGHQVHGDESRPGRVPLRSNLDRDLPQEEHAGTGVRMFPGFLLRTHVLEQSVTGGRTHAEEETTDGRSKVKLSPGEGGGDDTLQERDESLAAESVRQMPELRERREDRCRVHGGPGPMHGALSLHPLRPQGAACV